MRIRKSLIGLTIGVAALTGARAFAGPPTCDPALVAAAQSAIDSACPCAAQVSGDAWKNHGQYVHCVAHETAQQVALSHGALKRFCLRTSVSCGARSTCGKPDFVACTVTIPHTCNGAPNGTCDNPPHAACSTDADCATTHCSIKSSSTLCSGVSTTGSCCQ